MKRSIQRYWKSDMLALIWYRRSTVTNWIAEYSAMYLKHATDVASAARPSRMSCSSGVMFCVLAVKGAAIDASASLSDSPTAAALSAPQSLAPSPHIPTTRPRASASTSISCCFCSGDIRAYTRACGSSCSSTVGASCVGPATPPRAAAASSRRQSSSLCRLYSAAQTVPVTAISAPASPPTPAHSRSACRTPSASALCGDSSGSASAPSAPSAPLPPRPARASSARATCSLTCGPLGSGTGVCVKSRGGGGGGGGGGAGRGERWASVAEREHDGGCGERSWRGR